jgi:hypothetical protein
MQRGIFIGILATATFGCSPAGTHSTTDSGPNPGEDAAGNGTGGTGGTSGASGTGGSSGGGSGGRSGGGTGGMFSADGPSCGVKTFGLTKIPPDLLIVQDKSGSMDALPDGTTCRRATQATCMPMTKWPQITTAITQVVMQTESAIRWGLKFFPEDATCGVNAGAVVPVANMNAAAITMAIAAQAPSGGTPTRDAITSAGAYLSTLADPNPKYILLATDGEPNCGAVNIFGSQDDDSMAAIQAVKDVAAMGIPVFVVGIGTVTGSEATLTAMAIAGGQPQTAAPRYYPVASTAELVTVLGTIGGMVGSCSFGLGTKPPNPDNVTVAADGIVVPRDPTHANGWDYGTGGTSIQLFGKPCDDARAGKLKDVKAVFGCPEPIVP